MSSRADRAAGPLARPGRRARPDFRSSLRGPELASRVGLWLGICFGIAFLTGLFSHFHQDQPSWLPLPTRPVWIYQVTQGLHVAAGTAAVPLLLVKLWTVFPRLFLRVPWRDVRALSLHLAERGSIAVLVAGAVFELATGVTNITHWYPWEFSFRSGHYAVAWLVTGALVLHIAVKLPVIREAWSRDIDDSPSASPSETSTGPTAREAGLTRRGLLRTGWLAAGAAVLTTAGSTVPLLRTVSVFGVRSGNGPQGIPVNKAAHDAHVISRAMDPSYMFTVADGDATMTFSRAQLAAMPQHSAELPIACVEGWCGSGVWSGVRLRDLLRRLDVPAGTAARVHSLQPHGPFRSADLPGYLVDDPLTLLALRLDGEDLAIDHGYPLRLIAPGRPGVLQTKWLSHVETAR